MPEGKVIGFPLRTAPATVPPGAAAQASLFADPTSGRGRIAFVDIGKLAEEPLLRILTLNGVTALVDLRPCPVFERPRFRHKHVVFYLHDRGISYVEYALVVRRARERSTAAMDASAAYAEIEPLLEKGMSICIYDAKSRELGWIDDMRRVLRHSRTFLAELHPRALDGMPI